MRLLSLKTNRILFLIFALLLLPEAGVCTADGNDANPVASDTARRIRYSFTLRNTTGRVIPDVTFLTYAPVKKTAVQQCLRLRTSHSYKLINNSMNNQVLAFSFQNFPPYTDRIVTIEADLIYHNELQSATDQNIRLFLNPEKYIQSDAPAMIARAGALKAADTLKTAKKIFQWVSRTVKYNGYISKDRGALYALKQKKGDCTEMAYLFTALCRANQIPARAVGGYICSKNCILKPERYHNWAEFYDNGVWKLADPKNKVFTTGAAQYITMNIIGKLAESDIQGFHRFRIDGKGVDVKMNR